MRKLAVVKQTSQKQLLPQRNNTDGELAYGNEKHRCKVFPR